MYTKRRRWGAGIPSFQQPLEIASSLSLMGLVHFLFPSLFFSAAPSSSPVGVGSESSAKKTRGEGPRTETESGVGTPQTTRRPPTSHVRKACLTHPSERASSQYEGCSTCSAMRFPTYVAQFVTRSCFNLRLKKIVVGCVSIATGTSGQK